MKPVIAIAVACAACSGPDRPSPQQPPDQVTDDAGPVPATDPSVPASADPVASGAIVHKPQGARKTRVEAPHGGAITLLAATPDGKSALTCDELGGVRLWPALDGSTEPRAVDLPPPRAFAIGREPRGFVVAMLDPVGGLVVQVIDNDGITLQRASLPVDPSYGGVAMTEKGPIAWRTDQRVLRFAADGSITADLPTEATQRVLALTVTGDRAVAVIETGGTGAKTTQRARWLTLEPQLAWGNWITAGDDVPPIVALSPGGKRLAMLQRTRSTSQVIVIDTGTGTLVANEPMPAAGGIALPSNDQLAVATPGTVGVTWKDLATAKAGPRLPLPANDPGPLPTEPAQLVAGAGRAISAVNGELLLATPSKMEFLGYELESPAVAAAAPKGNLLIGLGESFALLDEKLVASAAPDLSVPSGSAVADLRHLAGDEWLVESSRINDGVTAINLVDTTRKKSASVRKGMSMVHMMLHDPATHLVSLSLGDNPEVLRYAPGKLELRRVATLPKPTGFERAEIVPVDPALAKGAQLVVVHMRDRLTLRWVRDPAALDAGVSTTIDGSLASVDAAGHVYVWQSDPKGMLELVIYADGKRLHAMPTDGPTAVWPDRKGARVVQVGQRSISMVTLDGTRKWAQPLQGVTEAIWLDDGGIAIVSAAGIARLDAATGNVQAARCGWRFGLATKQHPVSPRVEPVCTQLR